MKDEQDTSKDWGNLRFDPRRPGFSRVHEADASGTRFLIGLVTFLVVAALYPWYSYEVQSHLMTRDLAEFATSMEQEANREVSKLTRQMAQASADQQARNREQRIQRVQVKGASVTAGRPVVIVDLGNATLREATPEICRTAPGWLGFPVAGRQLEIQRHRGKAPAAKVGRIQC
jgi:hypothetical protein